MAIYSLNVSNVSRGTGSSSLATLSYISGQKIYDERLGKTYNYGRKQRIVQTGTMLPEGAPFEFTNPETMFNSIEQCDHAKNARTAKKIMIALPRELDLDQQINLIERYIKVTLTDRGYAAVYAIHTDEANHNPHVHILVPNRAINQNTGKWQPKRIMDYARDEEGNRIPIIDKKTGKQKIDKRNRKQWKRIDISRNELDRKETVVRLRKTWTKECNRYLLKDQQIDDRSYADRKIAELPTVHEGYAARSIEQRGIRSDRCQENRDIREDNKLIKILKTLRSKIEEEALYERIRKVLGRTDRSTRTTTKPEYDITEPDCDTEEKNILAAINNRETELRKSETRASIAAKERAKRDAQRQRQAAERSAENTRRKRKEEELSRLERERIEKERERSREYDIEI